MTTLQLKNLVGCDLSGKIADIYGGKTNYLKLVTLFDLLPGSQVLLYLNSFTTYQT